MKRDKSWIWHFAYICILVGALNWGLIGALNFNAVQFLLGDTIAAVIYVVIGLSSLYIFFGYLMNYIEEYKYD